MRIKDVMTREVIALGPEDTLLEAIAVFSRKGISGAPVVDSGNRVVGILTEMDILRRLELGSIEMTRRPRRAGRKAGGSRPGSGLRLKALSEALRSVGGLRVSKVMTSSVVTVRPDDPVEEKATLMVHKRIRRLPVVDDRGVLVGVVSRKDLIRMLGAITPAREMGR